MSTPKKIAVIGGDRKPVTKILDALAEHGPHEAAEAPVATFDFAKEIEAARARIAEEEAAKLRSAVYAEAQAKRDRRNVRNLRNLARGQA